MTPTTARFARHATLINGTYGFKGFPLAESTTRTTSPIAMPHVKAISLMSKYKPSPNVGKSCITIPFWNRRRDPNWETEMLRPSKTATVIISNEFTSPTRTMQSVDAEGQSHPLKMSMDTTLDAPISAESAVDMIAARAEQVMTVTRMYSNGPVSSSWFESPVKAVASWSAFGHPGSNAAFVRPMMMPGGCTRNGATSSAAMTIFSARSNFAM
mmetsp:Transcript_182450/g.444090  ORF Transcript_182450/g.444090 Transcript_182450/m.444090 type:complete len:213 (+) Transcript_182450:539-1177(+)